MKKIKLLFFILLLAFNANSQSLLVEEFDYPLTDLLGQGSWANTLAGTPTIKVSAPTISYPGYPGSETGNEIMLSNTGQDLNKLFTAQTSGTVYVSFLVKINTVSAMGDYFVNLSSSPMLTSNFVSRVYVKSSGSKFAFGIARFTSITYTGFDYDLNTPYLIVMKYEINGASSIASMTVNPVLSVDEPTSGWLSSTVGSAVPSNIGSICIRQGTITSAPSLNLDGLHIGTSWHDLFSALVPSGSANVSTQAASSVASSSATLNGTVVSLGSSPVTSYGFCLNTTGTPTIADTKLDKGTCSVTGAYTFSASNLNANTTYYVRAYATNSAGTVYGTQVSFTTLNTYQLTTNAASNILAKSATLNGSISYLEPTAISNYGFCWNTTGTPTIANSKEDLGTNPTAGDISKNISGLNGSTTYYYRTFATSGAVTTYGSQQSFTTALPDDYDITVQINGNGTVNANGVSISSGTLVNVLRAATKTFTFVPNAGYQITAITYNGVDVYAQLVNNQFTTPAVNAYGTLSVTFGNNIKTINIATAGTLSSLLSAVDKSIITNLTVTGNIDVRDFITMRDAMPLLAVLDLSGAHIIAYSGTVGSNSANQIPSGAFCIDTYPYIAKTTLRNVILPSTATSIGYHAFFVCTGISTVKLGSINYIDSEAFGGCTSLTKIICQNTTPPSFGIVESFYGDPISVVYVPVGCVPAYKAVSGWSSFNIQEYKLKATTQAVTAIKLKTAKLNATVDVITDSPVTAHGFCWNTTGTPTIADSKMDNGAKTTEGSFSNEISGLTEATTYYVRAFATDGTSGTVYGDEVSFTTATVPATSSVCGNFYTSQYWPLSKSPYTICGNVNLAAEANLTIEPGVVINFTGNYEIMTMSSIYANGTATDSITFNAYSGGCTFLDFKNTKLSDSELSYLKLIGKTTTTIKTQGTCSDSLTIKNSRVENTIVNSGLPTYFSNSKIKSLIAGSSFVRVNNSSLLNSTFGDYNSANVSIQNSNASNITLNGYSNNSNINIQNSIIKSSNFVISYAVVKKSKLYKCDFAFNGYLYPTIILDSTILNYTSISPATLGITVSSTVTNCIFINDSIQTINLKGVTANSQFIGNNNKIGGVGLDAVTGTITNSTIVNHRIGLKTGALTINNSNFINNSQYAIKDTSAIAIDAKNNFWGVGNTTTATVKAKIWDYYTDMNLGIVSFTNFLTTPNIDAPITPPMNFRKTVGTSGVNYSWSANPETDIKGYKLYYGAFDGFTFAHSLDVGNVTSYNLPTAAITDTVLITAYDLLADGKNDMIEGHESWYSDDVPFPAKAGVISGSTTVCQGQNAVVYTVPAITNATSYIWTLPTGATGISTTRTITVNYSKTAVSGNVTVIGRNEYGDGAASSLAVTVNPLPSDAGVITGTTTVCQGQSAVVYTIDPIANATSYVWTLPTGATGTSTTNSIAVNFSKTAVAGNITVKGNNGCGVGVASTLAISVNLLPANAGTITGATSVCQGENGLVYSVPVIANATSYVWTLPTGASGTSTTNSITVNYSKTSVSGSITVKGNDGCGDGMASSLAITIKPLPVDAGVITGATTVCQGQNSVVYSVPAITNATNYIWTLPTGATGISTTRTITVNYGTSAVSGNITVKGNNACGDGVAASLAVTVNPLPAAAEIITGNTAVCQGENGVVYTVPTIANATSYVWTLPTGTIGTSTTNSITVSYSKTAVSGNLTVKGSNDCGVGSVSSLSVTVNPLPADAGTITGLSGVCAGEKSVTYSVPSIANATSYSWTLPTGATGTSTTNSIIVNYSTTAVSGSISVKGNNSCGDGLPSSIPVSVKPLVGDAGIISGATTVCQGESNVNYSVAAIPNATSYIWTLPNGATGISSTNNISVNYSRSAISGNITVKGSNSCGEGISSSLPIIVNLLPTNNGIINGSATVCAGEKAVVYTVSNIDNATSYVWSLPNGASGTSVTNSIAVDFSNTAASGNVTVKGINSCGESSIKTFAVNVKPLVGAIGAITGATAVCIGQMALTYSVPAVNNATSYVWTLPNGAGGSSTTNSIVLDFLNTAATSGNITVKAINSCNESQVASLAITVNRRPTDAEAITGAATVCAGEKSVTYSVPTIPNATSYIWTLPSGATGISTTNSITVDYATTAVSGNVTVKGNNDCGAGVISSLAVTVKQLLGAIGSISGATTVCAGETGITYTIPAVTDANSYEWTLPNGATGFSTSNSIMVDFSSTATSGNVTVKAINSCGESEVSSLAITVNEKPATPVITRIDNKLHSDATVGNQWYNKVGLISNATSQDYIVDKNDDYYVIVTKNGCSSDKSNVITVNNTAVESIEFNNAISIYPNPVKDELRIDFDGETKFSIINLMGQIVYNANLIKSSIIQTTNLPSGVYLIKFDQGKLVAFKKFVKE